MTFLDFIKTPAFALAVIFAVALFFSLYAKIKAGKTPAEVPEKEEQAQPAAKTVPAPEGVSSGELELVETDEKTAAVIMALVSHKSNIPLNRLSFKSIRLMEDN